MIGWNGLGLGWTGPRYRKVGGLHFLRWGRLGLTLYWAGAGAKAKPRRRARVRRRLRDMLPPEPNWDGMGLGQGLLEEIAEYRKEQENGRG